LGLKKIVSTLAGLATHRRIAPTYFTNHWDRTLADTQALKFPRDFGGHIRRRDLLRKLIDQFC